MGIRYIIVDNLNETGVNEAVEQHSTRLKELNMLEYYGIHPRLKEKIYDRIALYEVIDDKI